MEVFDFNQAEDGCLYMAMELLEGKSLTEYLKSTGKVAPRRWLTLLTQIADGLESVHRAGVVHRDLKPDNLFLARNRQGNEVLKILDFGISKIKTTESMQTQAGAIMGTPNYMSPEQAAGETQNIDARTDIFSLGAITYEALSGKMAFGGPSLPAIFMKICFEDPRSLSELAPQLPPGAIAAVSKALNKDPVDRFDSVQSFVTAFRAGLESSEAKSLDFAATAPTMMTPGEGLADTLLQGSSQTTLSGAASEATLLETPLPFRRRMFGAIIIGIAGLMLVVGFVVFLSRGSGSSGKTVSGGSRPSPSSSTDASVLPPSTSIITPLIVPDASLPHREPIMSTKAHHIMRTSMRRKRRRRPTSPSSHPRPRVMKPSLRRRAAPVMRRASPPRQRTSSHQRRVAQRKRPVTPPPRRRGRTRRDIAN